MSKSLKKILVTGASLLMFASVGAGISGNTNSASANVALTSESQYRKIRGARVIATRPHGSRRPFGDNTTLGYVNGNSVIVNGNGEVTRIDGRHATRSLFNRIFNGYHHYESQANRRYRASLRRKLRAGQRKLRKYDEMDKKRNEAIKSNRKAYRRIREIEDAWQRPMYNPQEYKGKYTEITERYANGSKRVIDTPYSISNMKTLLNQYSRNSSLKSLAGMWDIIGLNRNDVLWSISFKPISRRTVKSILPNPKSQNYGNEVKRDTKIIDQLRFGTVRQTGRNKYVVSLEPKSLGHLNVTRTNKNTLKLQNYMNGKNLLTDYAYKENPRTRAEKNEFQQMWKYRPYGYLNDGDIMPLKK